MEANEAPEKIYVHEASAPELTEKLPYHIEYTRTDAFIDKALAYLNSKFYFHNAFYGVVSTDFNAMEELFEDFKNYMEGE
jgi:hypothetical protein